jgi:hypothetical protein
MDLKNQNNIILVEIFRPIYFVFDDLKADP